MKKVVYVKRGVPDSIEIIDVENPDCGSEEVKVRVHKAGMNFADLMMRQGLYGNAPNFPFTPGFETSGKVMEVGSRVDSVEVGDRVIAMTGNGGFAEEVVVSPNRIVKIPDSMSFDAAASIPVTYGTAYHMLIYLGNLTENESVLIHHAAGGVGTAAAQICASIGVSTIVGTASSGKREFVESLGMKFVDREKDDFVKVCKDLTDGFGVHQAIDPVGGKNVEKSYRALRNGGKLHVFGASSAVKGERRSLFSAIKMWMSTPRFNPIKMMSSNKSIFGVHMGTLKDEKILKNHLSNLSKMYESGGINPIIDSIWDYREIAEAQKHMHNRKNKGKILLDFVPNS